MLSSLAAEIYLQTHLKYSAWIALDEATQTTALQMAHNDICLYLGIEEIDQTRNFQLYAAYEQAIFLAENYDRLSTGSTLKSEKISAVGSATYRTNLQQHIAPRALTFLRAEAPDGYVSRG